jgi:hypothetical protein
MTIQILESAKRDLINGFYFYEKQREGLGNYFLDSLYSYIDSLLIYAGIHSVRFDEYYCMLSKRFPFAIYYHVRNETIYVNAILDCRQHPERIEKRLGRK